MQRRRRLHRERSNGGLIRARSFLPTYLSCALLLQAKIPAEGVTKGFDVIKGLALIAPGTVKSPGTTVMAQFCP